MNKNVLSLIKAQHDSLRESMKVLKEENIVSSAKIKHLERFIKILKMHSEAEENTLYSVMKDLENDEMIILEALEEHRIAKELITDLEDMNYKNNWTNETTAKAKVLAEMVEHHADEEEDEVFSEARRNFTSFELEGLGDEFQRICDDFETKEEPGVATSEMEQQENIPV